MASDKPKRKYFGAMDIFVVAVIIASFVLSLFVMLTPPENTKLKAVISVDGNVYSEILLEDVDEAYDITVSGNEDAVIRVSSDGVGFVSSECPDKLCVNTGMLTRAGQSAVCLPARISVKLVSENTSDMPDVIAG